mgnify:CR=1 FL=1
MIKVKLILLNEEARKLIGKREITLELPENKATISNLLKKIAIKYGDKILSVVSKPDIFILINGQYIDLLGGMNANLSNGDRVAVISVATGG